MASVFNVLVETASGIVEVSAFGTRIKTVLFLEDSRATRDDVRRITIVEDTVPIYAIARTTEGWREEPVEPVTSSTRRRGVLID